MSIPEFRIAYHPGTGTKVCEHVVCAQCALYNVTVPIELASHTRRTHMGLVIDLH